MEVHNLKSYLLSLFGEPAYQLVCVNYVLPDTHVLLQTTVTTYCMPVYTQCPQRDFWSLLELKR